MSCDSDFRNNKALAKMANNFDKFLDTRSSYDAEYLKLYDTLALNAPSGPNPGLVKEHYCSNCGQPKNTKLQNLQNPYSPCMNCGSIHRAQEQAKSPLYIGRSQYDITYDKKYDTLSLNAAAGPNPDQRKNNSPSREYYQGNSGDGHLGEVGACLISNAINMPSCATSPLQPHLACPDSSALSKALITVFPEEGSNWTSQFGRKYYCWKCASRHPDQGGACEFDVADSKEDCENSGGAWCGFNYDPAITQGAHICSCAENTGGPGDDSCGTKWPGTEFPKCEPAKEGQPCGNGPWGSSTAPCCCADAHGPGASGPRCGSSQSVTCPCGARCDSAVTGGVDADKWCADLCTKYKKATGKDVPVIYQNSVDWQPCDTCDFTNAAGQATCGPNAAT